MAAGATALRNPGAIWALPQTPDHRGDTHTWHTWGADRDPHNSCASVGGETRAMSLGLGIPLECFI